MKLVPVTELDKRNTILSKNYDVFVIFQFMVIWDQFESIIPDAWSLILKFSWIKIFHLTKIENKTKKYVKQLSHYCFS